MRQPQNNKGLDWVFTKQRQNNGEVENQGEETLFPEGLSLKNGTDLVITLFQCKSVIA